MLPSFEEERIDNCLEQLLNEGFVQEKDGVYRIAKD